MAIKTAKQTQREYLIGGYSVHMTDQQAARWNAGTMTLAEMGRITLTDHNDQTKETRTITLRRATNEKLEPHWSRWLDGPAELANP